MGILKSLFGPKASKEVEKVLADLKSNDASDRMMAMTTAARLLGQGEPGALRPFLLALKDEDGMIRGSVAISLEQAAADGLLQPVLLSAVKDSEEGPELMELLKDVSEGDSEDFVREGAKTALDSILACLEE